MAEALAALDGQNALVLDLHLPDGLGTDVLRRIRNEGRTIRTAIWSASNFWALRVMVDALAPDAV